MEIASIYNIVVCYFPVETAAVHISQTGKYSFALVIEVSPTTYYWRSVSSCISYYVKVLCLNMLLWLLLCGRSCVENTIATTVSDWIRHHHWDHFELSLCTAVGSVGSLERLQWSKVAAFSLQSYSIVLRLVLADHRLGQLNKRLCTHHKLQTPCRPTIIVQLNNPHHLLEIERERGLELRYGHS